MKCHECCTWDAPLNVTPIAYVNGKKVVLEGAMILMSYQQHLFYHLHVVLHQEINSLGLPS